MKTTRIKQHIQAPRPAVYQTLLDPAAVAEWKVPDDMTCVIHAFEAWQGGAIRVSLTYESPTGAGKTTSSTDTYHGRFVKLVPNEQVIEVDEFETVDPAMGGEMSITMDLVDAEGGTDLFVTHENLPEGLSPEDNEIGWRLSLAKLAALLERGKA
ncbi:MAG TPA: SRPBCC domain-containing protein [Prosthecobacter sp.]